MGFKKHANKKFDYKPIYYKGEKNPYQLTHKFDDFRTSVGKNKGLKAKFTTAYDELKSVKKVNKIILYIVFILLFLFLYIIDFDLSIFYPKG